MVNPVSSCSSLRFSLEAEKPLALSQESEVSFSSATDASPIKKDTEGVYYKGFEQAFEEGAFELQCIYLEQMGNLALQNKDTIKAAYLFNSALTVAKSQRIKLRLFEQLERAEALFLKENVGVQVSTARSHYIQGYRDWLSQARARVRNGLEQNNDIFETQGQFSIEARNILSEMVGDGMRLMGEVPSVDFAVMALGSMARGEMCPYSDVEFAIIIGEETPDVLKYFRTLSRFLELRYINLGETEWKIVRPKRQADGLVRPAFSFIPRGCSMDIGGLSPLGKVGVYELIGTPKKLAGYHNPEWLKRNEGEIILANALVSCSFVCGKEALFQDYTTESSYWLQRKHQTFALDLLRGSLKEFRPYLTTDRIHLRAFDVKRDFYRPLQIGVHVLRIYWGRNSKGTLPAIQWLSKKGYIGEQEEKRLIQALRILLTLRVKAQLFYGKEKDILYRCRGKEDSEGVGLFILEDRDVERIIEVYRVLIPFHKALEDFLKDPNISLRRISFYDETVGKLEVDLEESLLYEEAESSYTQLVALDPENSDALYHLQRVKVGLGDARTALSHSEERLRIVKEKYGSQAHLALASANLSLGITYVKVGEPKKALPYLQESLRIIQESHRSPPSYILALALVRLGDVWARLGNKEEAQEFFQKAIDMKEEICSGKPSRGAANYLNSLGMYWIDFKNDKQKSLDFHQQALEMRRTLYDNKLHPEIIDSLHNIGDVWQRSGNPEKALKFQQQVLSSRIQVYRGRPHPSVAASLDIIARSWDALGNKEKALNFYRQVVNMQKNIHNNEPHPDVAFALNNLGVCLHRVGDREKGGDYLEQGLAMREKIYQGYAHPDTAFSLRNMGDHWIGMKNPKKAFSFYNQSLKILQAVHKDEPHPDMAISLNSLATSLYLLGNKEATLGYLRQALAMREELHGDTPHPHTALILKNLGEYWLNLGNNEKARQFYERTLKMTRAIHKDQPRSDIANSLDKLGIMQREHFKNPKEALLRLKEALNMKLQIYQDKPHISVAKTLYYTGLTLRDLKDRKGALEAIELCAEVTKKVQLPEEPNKLFIDLIYECGLFFQKYGEYKKALDYWNQGLEKTAQRIPLFQAVMILHQMGEASLSLKAPDEAVTYFRKAWEKWKEAGDREPNNFITGTLYQLGMALKTLGKKQKALVYLEQSYQMGKSLGRNPKETFMAELVTLCQVSDEWEKALGYLEQTLEKQTDLNSGHPKLKTVSLLRNMGVCWVALGDAQKGLDCLLQAERIHKEICGEKKDIMLILIKMAIGASYTALGNPEKGSDVTDQGLAMLKEISKGKPHYLAPILLISKGKALQDLRDNEKALECFQESLSINRTLHKQAAHLYTVIALYKIGSIHRELGEGGKALELCQKSLDMARVLYGEKNHSQMAHVLHEYGATWRVLGQTQRALMELKRAHSMREAVYKEKPHPKTAETLYELAQTYRVCNEVEEVLRYARRALHMALVCLGEAHPRTKVFKAFLESQSKVVPDGGEHNG